MPRVKQPLNVARGGRKECVRGDGRNNDQIDLQGHDTSLLHGILRGSGGHVGWYVSPLSGDAALLDSGAGGDPVVARLDDFLEIGVGQDPLRARSCRFQ